MECLTKVLQGMWRSNDDDERVVRNEKANERAWAEPSNRAYAGEDHRSSKVSVAQTQQM